MEAKTIYKTMLLIACVILLVSVCGAAYNEEYSKGCFKLLLVFLNLRAYEQLDDEKK